MAFERFLGSKRQGGLVYPRVIAWPLTFAIVVVGWVLFRAPTVAVAMDMYQGMLGLQGTGISEALRWQIQDFQLATLLLAYSMMFFVPYWRAHTGSTSRWSPDGLLNKTLVVWFVLAVFKLSAQSYSPFLYFQF
jgi:alginate O-acetyltransferase complex protein AlgI